MNKPIRLIILLSFIVILLTLISRQQHILPTFICLEGLILFIIYYIPIIINLQSINSYSIIIIILTIRVSRASIRLALLVIARRKEGNDSTTIISTYIC